MKVALCFLALLAPWAGRAADLDISKLPAPAPSFDFDLQIKPLLEKRCVSCHGETKQKGHFRLDSRAAFIKGGENGSPILEGKSAESPLIHYVARLVEDLEMPPKKEDALKPDEIALLRAWIDAGAKWPDGLVLKTPVPREATPDRLASLPPPAAHQVDFVREIQPIFQAACYECHGPRKQEAEFRLDHKPTLFKGGELGVAVVPGQSAESLLIHFIAGLREEGVMPKKGPKLTDAQIGLLRAWIDQGAEFPDSASVVLRDNRNHWAFRPPVKAPLPETSDAVWPANPIDHFILARLEKDGLHPSPEAEKAALLRRLSLDLTGLPPTIAELDAFLADHSPDAYPRQVERLLASPHYGERWGRHWLDAARYADSDGYEKDKPRWIWFYRDWVIDAFNRDLPYDQFIVEQLAGDLLPNPTQDQIVATGFLRNSVLNEEGGVDPEQFRMDAMFDRMDALGKSVLGLGIACAQCHDHKYDPISQEEYYRVFAYLNNDYEGSRTAYTAGQLQSIATLHAKISDEEARLREQMPDWEQRLAEWEDAASGTAGHWTVLALEHKGDNDERYTVKKDGSILAQGYAPTKHTPTFLAKTDLDGITGFRLELFTDPDLPAEGPGRSYKGTCALTEFQVEAAGPDGKAAKQKIASATADFGDAPDSKLEPYFEDKSGKNRVTGPIDYAIDDKDETAWGIDAGPGRRNSSRKAVFVLEKPLDSSGSTNLTIRLKQNHGGWNSDDLMTNNLGRFRVSVTTDPNPVADPVPKRIRDLLALPRPERTTAQQHEIFAYWRTTVPEWHDANVRIETLWQEHPDGKTTLILHTRPEPRETHLLKRGDWLKPGRPVKPGVLAVLNPLPADAPPTRLTLARWLADPKAPTTARAFVNRVWQAYFGIGIVSTSEDLGTQAEAPSHPELLDWLACELMESGWSIKHLHRLIVTSATYRQRSTVDPALYQRDQFNRLLARGPRFRVEGEIVRDIQLATSGLLNPQMGGMPVMPPAPLFIFQPPASYAPFPWVEATGSDRYRRAVYTWRRRSTPFPMLQTFDAPEGNTSCTRRNRSNTPLQALMLLNETVSMEAARALAKRILEEGGNSDQDRLTFAFRCCLSRPPAAAERDELLALLQKEQARIASAEIDPWELATGKKDIPKGDATSPSELAAYTVVSRVLLNLDETITKE